MDQLIYINDFLSSLFTVTIYVVGHLTWSLRLLQERVPSAGGRWILEAAYRVLPNLEYLNIKGRVVHQLPVSGVDVGWAALYGLSYTAIVLMLAMMVFRKRDFL